MVKFELTNEENNKKYSILLNFNSTDEFYDWIDENDNEYDSFVDELEENYGVHDFDGEPGIVGYSSYEIEKSKYPEVMDKWSKFWEKHNKLIK